MNTIHFGTNHRFWLWRGLGAILMAAISGAMVVTEGWRSVAGWFGIAGVLFFGIATVVGLWQGTRRGPRLTLDEEGLRDRTLNVGVIAWTDIISIEPYGVAGQPFIGLRLQDPSKYLERTSGIWRMLAWVNSGSGFPLSLNLVGLDADPLQVVDLIIARYSQRDLGLD
jgi:hypothetical protein